MARMVSRSIVALCRTLIRFCSTEITAVFASRTVVSRSRWAATSSSDQREVIVDVAEVGSKLAGPGAALNVGQHSEQRVRYAERPGRSHRHGVRPWDAGGKDWASSTASTCSPKISRTWASSCAGLEHPQPHEPAQPALRGGLLQGLRALVLTLAVAVCPDAVLSGLPARWRGGTARTAPDPEPVDYVSTHAVRFPFPRPTAPACCRRPRPRTWCWCKVINRAGPGWCSSPGGNRQASRCPGNPRTSSGARMPPAPWPWPSPPVRAASALICSGSAGNQQGGTPTHGWRFPSRRGRAAWPGAERSLYSLVRAPTCLPAETTSRRWIPTSRAWGNAD